MPWAVPSWPVVGTVLGLTPDDLRSVITALARPSLASMVALIFGLAVYACWKIVPPLVLSQPGAKFSATRVAPPAVPFAPAATVLAGVLKTTLLYPVAKEIALGSVSSPPFST